MRSTGPGILMSAGLACTAVAMANPTPSPHGGLWGESEFSLMQTLELTFHLEGFNTPDSMGTWILYGGPSVAYVWLPEDDEGAGLGLELGTETRRYLKAPISGPFAGLYAGIGALWQSGGHGTAAVSAGVKLGWRMNFHRVRLPFDLEPYLGLGVMLVRIDDLGTWFDLAPTLYIGTKLDLY